MVIEKHRLQECYWKVQVHCCGKANPFPYFIGKGDVLFRTSLGQDGSLAILSQSLLRVIWVMNMVRDWSKVGRNLRMYFSKDPRMIVH